MLRFLLPILLLLPPAFAAAQPSCCALKRQSGQAAYDKGDFRTAIKRWQEGKECSNAAECADLDRLIGQAEARIKEKDDAAVKQPPKQPAEVRKSVPPSTYPPKPTMVRIPGGTFEMGDVMGDNEQDDETVHTVTVSDFYIGKYEVTFEEYDAFCNVTGRGKPSDEGWGRGKRPAINVRWYDAVEYCNWLSGRHGRKKVYTINGNNVTADWAADGYRLPTEAEWEYAARGGGRKVRFGNGKDIADPKEINFAGSAGYKMPYSIVGEYRGKTVPVGSLNSPNALGLHDMSGNVWEWCWDWYGSYPTSAQANPKGPDMGSYRVLRGGWLTPTLRHIRRRVPSGPQLGGSPFRLFYERGEVAAAA